MGITRGAWVTPACALSAVALWGLAFPLIQDGLAFFSPIMLGFLRFAFASALMLVIIVIRYKPAVVAATVRKEWRPLFILGALYVTIPNIAQNMGLEHGTSSIASVIQSSGPVMTMLFAALLLNERLTTRKGLGSAIAMAGTVLLVTAGGLTLGDDALASNMLILASAASYGLAWVSAKRMLERNPPVLIIGLSLAFGTLLLGAVVPFEPNLDFEFSQDALVNLALLGFLCGAMSSVLYLYSLEHEEVSKQAFFIYLMPLFASVFAWLLREETVALWTAVCGLVIICGVAVAQTGPRR